MAATGMTAPSAIAATTASAAAVTHLVAPVVGPQLAVLCHQKLFLDSAEPTFHAVLPDDARLQTGVSIQFRLTRVGGGEPRQARVATATVSTENSGVADWTPDYTRVGDLEDGTWAIAARELVTSSDGAHVQTSRWSGAKRFVVNTVVPATPTVTLNTDGSLTLAAPGATGFLWTFGALPVFGEGQEICVSSGDANGGTILANKGKARLVTGMTGPMFFTVVAYGPSGQWSAMWHEVIGFPG